VPHVRIPDEHRDVPRRTGKRRLWIHEVDPLGSERPHSNVRRVVGAALPRRRRSAVRYTSVVAAPESRDPGRVRAMFDGIARRYDFLNHLLSLNQDARWRRRAAEALPQDSAARVLDLCGGTGDQTIAIVRSGRAGLVVCCDFSRAMLKRALPKLRS